jgi:hypothetical protein
VPQESFLFSDTIAANLAYGDAAHPLVEHEHATDERAHEESRERGDRDGRAHRWARRWRSSTRRSSSSRTDTAPCSASAGSICREDRSSGSPWPARSPGGRARPCSTRALGPWTTHTEA